MDIRERLSALRDEQRRMSSEFETIVKEFNSDTALNENAALKKTLDSYTQELDKLRRELSNALHENDRLKLSLQEQIWAERLNILKISREKMAIYFSRTDDGLRNSLTELENDLRIKLERLKKTVMTRLEDGRIDFERKLGQLEDELAESIRVQENQRQSERTVLSQEADSRYNNLTNEAPDPEILKKRIRQNQIEMKIGLNWLNKIGILLILLGVGAAYRYSFSTWMSPWMKAASFFLLGLFFMVGGEWMHRKKNTVFAAGLIGGGVAILYGSIFYSYFWTKPAIIPLQAALLLSILVTACTVVLSLRYRSQTIGSFGLIGGFLPFLSFICAFGIDEKNILFLMGYLFILNLTVVLISLKKQWHILNTLSFILNSTALIYLAVSGPQPAWALADTFLTFVMYLTITLAYPLIHKKPLNAADVLLLGLNTVVGSILAFYLCDRMGLGMLRGLMALAFGLFFVGMGRMVQKILKAEKWTEILFYATALTFALLVVPFQFNVHWWALGWIVEAVLLIILGSRHRIAAMEITGWSIFLPCLFIFGCADLLPMLFGYNVDYFELKYFAISLGQGLILVHYQRLIASHRIPFTSAKQTLVRVYKYLSTIGFWIYAVHLGDLLCRHGVTDPQTLVYYRFITFALFSIVFGYVAARIRAFADGFIRGFAIGLYLLADTIGFIMNLAYPVMPNGWADASPSNYWALAILLVFNVFIFLNLRNLLLSYFKREGFSLENFPVLLGIYLFVTTLSWMTVQFHLGVANLLFSLVFLLMALAFVGYGFVKHFIYIRYLGLGLAGLTVLKFFIWDLAYLGIMGQIAAFFGFGIVLLIISFIYQKVKTTTEVNGKYAEKE